MLAKGISACAYTIGLLLFACLAIAQAPAQEYPGNNVIRLIVPFAAGSASDTVGRIMAEELSKSMGAPFIVDNKPGAGGLLGTGEGVRAAADGHTLILTSNSTHALAPFLYKTIPYDPIASFAHIARWIEVAFVLVVPKDSPAKTFAEFIAYAKANPGKLAFGYGTPSSQLSAELLNQMAGIKTLAVPYRSHPNAVSDLVAGQTQFMILDAQAATAQMSGGNLRALASTTKNRSPYLPDLPTIAESGYPDYEYVTWIGGAAPAGTPKPIIEKLNVESRKALAKAEVQKRFSSQSISVAPNTVDEQELLVKTGLELWRQRIQAMKIEPQ